MIGRFLSESFCLSPLRLSINEAAAELMSETDELKAYAESYPNDITLTFGNFSGRKSFNHSFRVVSSVQVPSQSPPSP